MPWLTIIMALLSFFLTKKKTGSTAAALGAAALVGAGTYYVTHETQWGSKNLGSLDGVVADEDLKKANGDVYLDANGNPVRVPTGSTGVYDSNGVLQKVIGTTGQVLSSWGGVGTAAVIGTTAAVSSGGLSETLKKYAPWLLLGGAVLILKR